MHTGHIVTIIVNMRPVCHAQLLAMKQLTLCNFVEGKLFASAHLDFTSSCLDILLNNSRRKSETTTSFQMTAKLQ